MGAMLVCPDLVVAFSSIPDLEANKVVVIDLGGGHLGQRKVVRWLVTAVVVSLRRGVVLAGGGYGVVTDGGCCYKGLLVWMMGDYFAVVAGGYWLVVAHAAGGVFGFVVLDEQACFN